MRHRRGAGQGQTCDHRQDGGEGHCRDEAHEHVAAHRIADQHRRHVGRALAAVDGAGGDIGELRVGQHQCNRTEADDEDQDVEVADPGGGPQHRLACLLGIGNGEEAHQDVRQAGGTEHQRHTEGDRRNRVLHETARPHDRQARLGCVLRRCTAIGRNRGLHPHALGKQRLEAEVEVPHDRHGHEGHAGQQQHRLDDLHPRRCGHATEQHVDHHQHADQGDRHPVVQAEQQLDQRTGADHLCDQIEQHHYQGARSRKTTDRGRREAVAGHVGEGVLAEVAQPFGHQEGQDGPTDQKADRVDQAVVAVGHHRGGDAQERGSRHEVAGDRQAVLKAGDAAAGGVEVRGRLGLGRRPFGDPQGAQHEEAEHADRHPVGGLLVDLAHVAAGGQREAGRQQAGQNQEKARSLAHLRASSRICAVSWS